MFLIRVRTLLHVVAPVLLAGVVAASSPAFSQFLSRALPAPPQLDPFEGKWHTDTYPLSGSIDSLSIGGWVRIRHEGVAIDSVTASLDRDFTRNVPLRIGWNTFDAVLVDSARVVSSPSNTVSVYFDTTAGFYYPIPFTPGASFDLNAVRTASGVELRVFDVTGNQVIHFESREMRIHYSFPWDGNNATGNGVRRGPLVAVGTIDYPDGTHEVLRQMFLFNPDGAP